MEYDDFSLSSNFEKMSKEYYEVLKNKGFVFVRLDGSKQERDNHIKEAYSSLIFAKNFYGQISYKFKNKFAGTITSLKNLTEFQITDFTRLYNLQSNQQEQKQNIPLSFDKIIKAESNVIKSLFNLLNFEDDHEKHTLLKNMINARLELLSN